jgi:hypothetical protein
MTTGIDTYSKTAGSNTTISGIDASEGSAASAENNRDRQQAADMAAWMEDLSCSNTTGGSANAQTLATDSAFTSLDEAKMLLGFTAGFTNTGTTTINVDSLGAVDLKKYTPAGLVALEAGDIMIGNKCIISYESTNSDFILLNPTAAGLGAAWTAYTPTISAGSGTITTSSVSAAYKQIGKTILVRFDITITTNGTGATNLQFTSPAAMTFGGAAGINITDRTAFTGYAISATNIALSKYDGNYPAVDGSRFVGTAIIELS